LPVTTSAQFARNVGWVLRNGVLLRAAVDAGFDVVITADTALRSQQNLPKIGIAIVLISGVRNRMRDLRPLMPRVLQVLGTVRKGELAEVVGTGR